MDRMKCESRDLIQANIAKLAELFPSVVTECRVNGKLRKAINFEALRQLMSAEVLDGDEAYEFTWVGKKAAIVEAGRPIRKTLRPCPAESKEWDTTENLYIEGDNLDVLKLLQESYLGKVRMIYIDPPYNTGNDFVYRDDFAMAKDEYQKQTGEIAEEEDGEKQRLFRNTDSNGRFHSDWCSMIYPRLMLARNLLRDDGVIFISCDDNEQENLKKICDEILGRENFIVTLIWNKQHSQQQGIFKKYHEYVVLYAKNITYHNNITGGNGIIDAGALKKISKSNPESDFTFPAGVKFDAPDGTTYSGTYGDSEKVTVKSGKLLAKDGKTAEIVTLSAGWTQKNQMIKYFNGEEVIDSKGQKVLEFYFTSSGKLKCRKERSSITPPSILPLYGMVSEQTKELTSLMNFNIFDNPKPVGMLKEFMSWFTTGDDIILDFFSGSATTAHALMQLNAEDGGRRKFIMVQLPEECAPDTEAAKSGYKNICEIGKERIRRAGEKIRKDNEGKPCIENLDIGFRVLKCDSANMKDVYYAPTEMDQGLLQDTICNIKEDRTDLDLLFGCLVEWGLPLSLPYKTEETCGYKVHFYDYAQNPADSTALAACFDANISGDAIKEIAKRKPLRAVFRDASFADSQNKINAAELFKNYAPDTEVKVL